MNCVITTITFFFFKIICKLFFLHIIKLCVFLDQILIKNFYAWRVQVRLIFWLL